VPITFPGCEASFGFKAFGVRTHKLSRSNMRSKSLAATFAIRKGMPRPQTIITNEHPYHVRARSNNRDWFDLPLEFCFHSFVEVLEKTCERYEIKIHCFMMMGNHIHMIVSTPKSNLSAAMRYFMTEASRRLRRPGLRINHIFGGRYKATVIDSEEYFANCVKYIARNPVRAGLVENVEDYLWSSFSKNSNVVKRLISSIETGHDIYIPDLDLIGWLNEPFPSEVEAAIKRSLKRNRMFFSASPITQKIPDPFVGLRCIQKK
jgi:putative transposase